MYVMNIDDTLSVSLSPQHNTFFEAAFTQSSTGGGTTDLQQSCKYHILNFEYVYITGLGENPSPGKFENNYTDIDYVYLLLCVISFFS